MQLNVEEGTVQRVCIKAKLQVTVIPEEGNMLVPWKPGIVGIPPYGDIVLQNTGVRYRNLE